ncbi:hypothetical protein PENFLA_c003G03854 [Penicillium flavigenum]|uniref:Uncharacterized protein n=1 Tax=Penicillium flavigenum TaxID=254877 RepID=A0A1V6TW50_9EURO|nr:hypothetical protein PENFLA_c003G03854 [Penicillium flavigenum]
MEIKSWGQLVIIYRAMNPSPSETTSQDIEPSPEPASPDHAGYREYMEWSSLVYHTSDSPYMFLRRWCRALTAMRVALGFPNLPEVLIFTHFITAVAANPETHQWIESILRTTNNAVGETVMDRTYRSFLLFEFRRLGFPQW